MDSQWNSSSFVEGTLECLLCRDIVDYVKGNRSAYIDHLKNVHKAKIHHNLMLAVTFMDNKSLENVINQFEESSKELVSNSGDESLLKENEDDPDEPSTIKDFGENEDTNKSVDAGDVKTLNPNKEGNDCEQCDKSFSSRAALNKHVSKNHESNEKRKTPNEDDKNEAPPAKSPKLSKESSKGVETTSKPIEYEYILTNSKFFKANPKQITSKCNTNLHNMDVFTLVDSSLPDGWKYREHTKPDGNVEKHYLAPDGRVIKSKKAVLEYLDVIDKHAAEQAGEDDTESDNEEKEAPKRLGNLKGRLASLSIERKPKGDSANIEKNSKEDSENTQQSQPKKRGRPSLSSKVNQQNDKENKSGDDSEKVSEVKKRRSGVDKKDSKHKDDDSDMKKRRSGVGTECPECHKVVSMPKQHMEDMHSPPGHFPCRGCKKVFTSKNKESSHYSRHCNPNKKK